MDENTLLAESASDANVAMQAESEPSLESNTAAEHITIGRKPRKYAAVAANPQRPVRHRRSFSYARRQR